MGYTILEGDLVAKGKRFAIVAARWNGIFTDKLLDGAVGALLRHGCVESEITVVRVPGCFEIPVVARELALSGNYDGIIGIGTLIRGETDHYQLIAGEVTGGLQKAMMESGVPVTFGVITVENQEQAMARSGSKAGNKGEEAAIAAIELASVLGKIVKARESAPSGEIRAVSKTGR